MVIGSKRELGQVLTVSRASEEIGVHHATLYNWISLGRAAYVEFGGVLFVPVVEVVRLKKMKSKKAAG